MHCWTKCNLFRTFETFDNLDKLDIIGLQLVQGIREPPGDGRDGGGLPDGHHRPPPISPHVLLILQGKLKD